MINQNKNYELIKFEDGDFTLDVNASLDEDTVCFFLVSSNSFFDFV